MFASYHYYTNGKFDFREASETGVSLVWQIDIFYIVYCRRINVSLSSC